MVTTGDGTLKDYRGVVIPNGTIVRDWAGPTFMDVFAAWTQGGCWDLQRSQFLAGMSNFATDLNAFDVPSGTWNPSGRPQRSYSQLAIHGHQSGTNEFAAVDCLFGIHFDAPLAFIVPVSTFAGSDAYADLADINPTTGTRLLPNTGHLTGAAVWMPSVGRVCMAGCYGAYFSDNGSNANVWEWSPSTGKWTADIQGNDWQPANALGGFGNTANAAVWDSRRNRVIALAGFRGGPGVLFAYDPIQAIGSRVTRMRTDLAIPDTQYSSMVYDAKRDQVRVYGAFPELGNQFGVFSFSSGGGTATVPALTAFAVSGMTWVASSGLLYDAVADRDVAWFGGTSFTPSGGGVVSGDARTLYVINPDTHSATALVPTGASPDIPSGGTGRGASVVSVWSRFAYLPTYDCYGVIPDYFTSGVFLFAPDRASGLLQTSISPELACTDITQGPRTGNSDTAFGQVANQDGAYVTIYGWHLGVVTDTVTVTINGASALIIARGQAVSPLSPATLYNQGQKLYAIIAQVNHLATVGAGTITVTVNGTVTNTLPFTVATGNIYFAPGNFATIQLMLDSMTNGDVGYAKAGTDATGGIVLGSNTSGANKIALVAYPSALVQLGITGSAGHDAFNGGYGIGLNLTIAKFILRGRGSDGNQVVTIGDAGRVVGCNIQAPGAFGSSGALGVFGSSTQVLANEMTQCGPFLSAGNRTDPQYHTIYRYGRRGQAAVALESGCEIAYNYLHDNTASRGINCFNRNQGDGTPGNIDNPIGDHDIHHNYILNQQWCGIGLLSGVVGTNLVHDNLLVNCGLADFDDSSPNPNSGQGFAVDFHPFPTVGYTPGPISVSCTHNTIVNSGSVLTTQRGVFDFVFTSSWALTLRNNLIDQPNGLPYLTAQSDAITVNAALRSNNLWFGAGIPPSFDTLPVNSDPLLTSAVTPVDAHLLTTSPAILVAVNLGGTSLDLDGVLRPAGTNWDIGAYQYTGALPSTVTLTTLTPSTRVQNDPSFVMTCTGLGFVSGCSMRWNGGARATIFVSGSTLQATVLASDLLAVGTASITVVNPDTSTSNALTFTVTAMPPPQNQAGVFVSSIM